QRQSEGKRRGKKARETDRNTKGPMFATAALRILLEKTHLRQVSIVSEFENVRNTQIHEFVVTNAVEPPVRMGRAQRCSTARASALQYDAKALSNCVQDGSF